MLLSMIILLFIDQSSTQTVYTCNSNALCGCSTNSTIVNRIINGEMSGTGTWGWAVSLSIQRMYICGGSIVSRSWIITAAHCVDDVNASQVIVYAGSNIRWSGSQSRKGLRIVVHTNYDASTFANDIALIELSFPLDMTDSGIHIICLPSVSSTTLVNGEWPVANTSVNDFLLVS
jgi:secreted trypsin-like serine protease